MTGEAEMGRSKLASKFQEEWKQLEMGSLYVIGFFFCKNNSHQPGLPVQRNEPEVKQRRLKETGINVSVRSSW